jgi:hypothetical protein
LLAGLLVGSECVVRERDEIEPVAAVVADLDERLVGVGLHDGSDRSGGPAAGVDFELDDVEDLVLHSGHVGIVAVGHGMSTHVEVRRGAASVATIQVVTTGAVRPLSPSIITITS